VVGLARVGGSGQHSRTANSNPGPLVKTQAGQTLWKAEQLNGVRRRGGSEASKNQGKVTGKTPGDVVVVKKENQEKTTQEVAWKTNGCNQKSPELVPTSKI